VSQESTSSNKTRPKFWNYWTFDPSGKLTDYRRGSGDAIQNHDTNLKRDGQGRLTSFEYRQGAKDELSSRTEFRYSPDGKTVDYTSYDATGDVTLSTTNTLDDQGHVVSVVIREWDWQTKKLKPPLRVTFRYDGKGRLIEQNTEAHEVKGPGSEQDLPPGKISITYDDAKHTKTTAYASNDGMLTSTLIYDIRGATIGMSGGIQDRTFDVHLECSSDSHENWTNCKQIARNRGVSEVNKLWRRTITYR
jgi:hypothetical protein